MNNDRRSEGNRWLDQARQDLEDASYCLEGKKYNVACFLSQQSAEKALKGYLVFRGAWYNSCLCFHKNVLKIVDLLILPTLLFVYLCFGTARAIPRRFVYVGDQSTQDTYLSFCPCFSESLRKSKCST